jgi:predicted RNase H-like HicB family nuclease
MTASEKPTIVHLTYGHEEGSWWAESEQLPSLFAGGDSLDEAKELAKQAVREEFGDEVSIVDWMPAPTELEAVVASEGTVSRRTDAHDWERGSGPALDWLAPEKSEQVV